mmetsp:Transcript_22088/g.57654  ORF Transcript_22088/g.57654 Transcript_22088/m.57654 type:complete len:238 (+) Transcript_22088:457-1170(+)
MECAIQLPWRLSCTGPCHLVSCRDEDREEVSCVGPADQSRSLCVEVAALAEVRRLDRLDWDVPQLRPVDSSSRGPHRPNRCLPSVCRQYAAPAVGEDARTGGVRLRVDVKAVGVHGVQPTRRGPQPTLAANGPRRRLWLQRVQILLHNGSRAVDRKERRFGAARGRDVRSAGGGVHKRNAGRGAPGLVAVTTRPLQGIGHPRHRAVGRDPRHAGIGCDDGEVAVRPHERPRACQPRV